MSKKSKKSHKRDTYVLCVTVGLIIGVGFGAILDNILITCSIGVLAGTSAGYYFTKPKPHSKKTYSR
ncbi:MAG: hypothetical protein CMQ35_02965 [Gammaproteobacteria bacterium]|nr:hypothetical protein [Gammaproteobacteria bacterium]